MPDAHQVILSPSRWMQPYPSEYPNRAILESKAAEASRAERLKLPGSRRRLIDEEERAQFIIGSWIGAVFYRRVMLPRAVWPIVKAQLMAKVAANLLDGFSVLLRRG